MKGLGIVRVVICILLAVVFLWASLTKLFQNPDKLAAMWPWTKDNGLLVKTTAIADLALGLGLLLPLFIRSGRRITQPVAWGVIILMVAASIFHVSRGEASKIGFNIVVLILAVVIILVDRRTAARQS